ncbi:bifunctional glutamate N-acetyltransferase/amino-acid acetyltransferase ArgJ [Aquihabitans daechungensis]|uniref:bifunctional glutamate N-acetyltransferase/amino-acid acetyltransferase ArgJ n=1 Tax=Aquihabitans daechungensis TaxID=1052257 RepID=UPI003B9E4FF0
MSVTAAKGFVASGVHCGVKPSGDLDLSLVATTDGRPVAAAAVFTDNKMTAAPVLTSDAHLARSGGRAAAVILNSGNANAATGAQGKADAQAMCQAVAHELGCDPHEVLVCSTGLIGIPLPIDTILSGVPALAAGRRADGDVDAAEAIRTTDTARKVATAPVGETAAVVGGMAKGAAMLSPNMATMLAVLTTDAEASGDELRQILRGAVSTSFNILMTDACRSTNDTVILLASGEAGPVDNNDLAAAVGAVCADLASQMAGDAEGATKVVKLTVTGAATPADAEAGARKIAASALCKCSWFGQDPYWGRLASELGVAGIEMDQERVAVSYGGVTVAAGGVTIAHDEAAVTDHMAQRHLDITCDLGLGDGTFTVLTNDLTHEYIDENTGGS